MSRGTYILACVVIVVFYGIISAVLKAAMHDHGASGDSFYSAGFFTGIVFYAIFSVVGDIRSETKRGETDGKRDR